MKKRYKLSYFIVQAVKSLWRNGVMSFASIAVLMSCLFVMGAFALLVKNINVNLTQINDLNQIVAFCDAKVLTEEEVHAAEESGEKVEDYIPLEGLLEKVKAIGGVKEVKVVNREQALEDMQKKMNLDSDFFEGEENPLTAHFEITYDADENASNIEVQLNNLKEDGIRQVNQRSDLAKNIHKFKNSIQWIFLAFLAILFVVTVFIIINTIKLALNSRRHEISVMRYVGATGWFITLPFIFEGIIIGLVASVIAYFVEMLAYGYLEKSVFSGLQMLEIIPFGTISLQVFAQFVVVGIVTGIIGSCISLGKYLKS